MHLYHALSPLFIYIRWEEKKNKFDFNWSLNNMEPDWKKHIEDKTNRGKKRQ